MSYLCVHPCLAEIKAHEKNVRYQYLRCANFNLFVARSINKKNHKRSVLAFGEYAPRLMQLNFLNPKTPPLN